ncbi:hypothetical protein [Kordia sp.]|uniref:hypothetical protein n=1 Tax=Kordia sp. TaxID=1965332 RepID=UPI0025C2D505|nr:hypothetical protein [Kordia sp.]MCH2193606.1 hypothetical protein [Kordia sp.]
MKNPKKTPVLDDRISQIYHLAQPGLMCMPSNGIFLTIEFNRAGKNAREEVLFAIRELTRIAEEMEVVSRIVAGFSARIWRKWTGKTPPGGPK